MASLPDGALDLITQLMQQMIELQRKIIALQRDGTPNTMQTSNTVGKIVIYLTSMWARFVGFSHLKKKKKKKKKRKKLKWRYTVAFVFDYLAWVTQTLTVPMQMRLCQVYKKSHGGNGQVS